MSLRLKTADTSEAAPTRPAGPDEPAGRGTKRKLREMNAGELLAAIDSQDETLSIGMPFEERVRLVVDDAYSTFTHSKVEGLSSPGFGGGFIRPVPSF